MVPADPDGPGPDGTVEPEERPAARSGPWCFRDWGSSPPIVCSTARQHISIDQRPAEISTASVAEMARSAMEEKSAVSQPAGSRTTTSRNRGRDRPGTRARLSSGWARLVRMGSGARRPRQSSSTSSKSLAAFARRPWCVPGGPRPRSHERCRRRARRSARARHLPNWPLLRPSAHCDGTGCRRGGSRPYRPVRHAGTRGTR